MQTLKTYRQEILGLTLEEMAKQTGISRPALSQVEAGRLHRFPKNRVKYANAYRLSIDDYTRRVRAAQRKGGEACASPPRPKSARP